MIAKTMLEKGKAAHSSVLAQRVLWTGSLAVHGVAKSHTQLRYETTTTRTMKVLLQSQIP